MMHKRLLKDNACSVDARATSTGPMWAMSGPKRARLQRAGVRNVSCNLHVRWQQEARDVADLGKVQVAVLVDVCDGEGLESCCRA